MSLRKQVVEQIKLTADKRGIRGRNNTPFRISVSGIAKTLDEGIDEIKCVLEEINSEDGIEIIFPESSSKIQVYKARLLQNYTSVREISSVNNLDILGVFVEEVICSQKESKIFGEYKTVQAQTKQVMRL